MPVQKSSVEGALLGVAVGDSIALPGEGISKSKLEKKGWSHQNWEHRLFFGWGMWSDDSEHTFMVGNAILASNGDVEVFRKRLSSKLRWWFLGFPAGVGMATARACLKLWMGFPPMKSGVFSAGNGPAMRSGIIGLAFPNDPGRRHSYTKASTEMTHSDPQAFTAALAIAETVAFVLRGERLTKCEKLNWICSLRNLGDPAWEKLIGSIETFKDQPPMDFASEIGCENGVSGYAYHTVPVVLHAWLQSDGDFRRTIETVANCGGDTDTGAAIAGVIAGAECGLDGIPTSWLDHLIEWPRTKSHFLSLSDRIFRKSNGEVQFSWWWLPFRNLFFLVIVISHGVLRIFR